MANNYKWPTAHDWLHDQYNAGMIDADELFSFILQIADQDQIQDHFQDQMDTDGYFDDQDLIECSECGNKVDKSEFDTAADMCNACADEQTEEEDADYTIWDWYTDPSVADSHTFDKFRMFLGDLDYWPWLDTNVYSAL